MKKILNTIKKVINTIVSFIKPAKAVIIGYVCSETLMVVASVIAIPEIATALFVIGAIGSIVSVSLFVYIVGETVIDHFFPMEIYIPVNHII